MLFESGTVYVVGDMSSRRVVSRIILFLMLMGMSTFAVQLAKSSPATIKVPDDYLSVQETIDARIDGDTIFPPGYMVATSSEKYEWSMFRHDLMHSGYTIASPLHYSPIIRLKWNFQVAPAYIFYSPIIADVNDDGKAEIIIGSANNNIYCLNIDDGSLLWCFPTGYVVDGSAATADINDDGKLEVVVGSRDGKIYALKGEDGSLLWSYSTGGQIKSSPAINDVNGDGQLDIVIGSYDEKIYALDGKSGSRLWSYVTSSSIWGSPAIADVNDDDKPEVIICSNDGTVYALRGENGSIIWNRYAGSGAIYSSPAIADLDQNGELEIVVGTGHGEILVLSGRTGQFLRSYVTDGMVMSSPAIADVDHDGGLDIVFGSHDKKIYAIRGVDCSKLWEFTTGDYVDSSPSIADITGDGELEVVVGSWDRYTYFLHGRDGSLLWSFLTQDVVQSNPAIANIDEGKLIVVVGAHESNVYAFETVWTVDDDGPAHFHTIQEAIDNVGNGDTIFVRDGLYYENLVIDKSLSLIGEDRETTKISGNFSGTVIHILGDEVNIENFTIQDSGSEWLGSGIRLESDYCTITGNLVVNNNRGILVRFSDSNNILSNNIMNNEHGISMWYSSHNKLRNNVISNNRYNFGIEGFDKSDFFNDIDPSNIINEKRIYCLANRSDMTFTQEAGYIALVNCLNIKVENVTLKNNFDGMLLAYTQNLTITKNDLRDNFRGLHFVESSNIIVNRNNLENNDCGIKLEHSKNNTFFHNNFKGNSRQVEAAADCTNVWDNSYASGGNYWDDHAKTDLYSGPFQNITGCDGIIDVPYDIDEYNRDYYPLMKPYGGSHDIGIVNITTSEALIVQRQNVSINARIINYGINNETFNVTAYANEIAVQTRKTTLTYRNSTTVTLTWNTTSFPKGRYTISAKAHPVSGETDKTDNTLQGNLVKIIMQAHDIAVAGFLPCETIVGRGTNVSINITTENWGNFTETFNVTAYYNRGNATAIPIRTQAFTLTRGDSTIITFMWSTTGLDKGNYTITAAATPVPEETCTSDNNKTSWLILSMIGDITGPEGWPDGKVDMRDIGAAASAFGSYPGHPRWNPVADINQDNKVDMRDIGTVARHFGETDP